MVYKKEKYHVRSGNTLRTPARGGSLYKRQAYLVRQSTQDIKSDVLDDLGFDKDNVAYSLNKKGRWMVPQILKHELANSDDKVKMDLVESHKLKRKAKYTAFHSNDGCLRKISPKKTYFDLNSVRCKTTSPKVTVNIEKPCPRSSSLACNPKYLDFTPTHNGNEDLSETDPKESSPKKNRTRTQRPKTFMRMAMDEYQDESDYSDNENYDLDLLEENYNPRLNNVYVGDILLYSNDMQGLLLRELDKSNTEDATRKPHYQHPLVEEVDENEATGNLLTTLSSFTGEMTNHIAILVPNTEVLTERLEEVFGEDYIECRCFPRKFIIDITEKVTSTILKSKASRNRDMKRADLSAVVVFAYDMFGSIDTADIDSFKVSINMMSTQQCLKIDTLSEMGVYGIEEVIQMAVSYIASMPCENFMPKDVPSRKTIPAKLNHNVLKSSTVEVTPASAENISIKDILEEKRKKHHQSMDNVDFEFIPSETCSICFGSILGSPATALEACGHWFCDQCWNDHVISTASSSTREITCPGYKCQSIVDYDVLLTVSNVKTVRKIYQRQINKEIDKDASSKWCPNKNCGRVIRYEKREVGQIMNVTCECGTSFCFDCLEQAHWPLSCRDHEKYTEKLKHQGDIDRDTKKEVVFTYIIRGKRCPGCKIFIEKEGGCFEMECICGTLFCWGCSKTLSSHSPVPCYTSAMRNGDGDLYRTLKKVVQYIDDGYNHNQPSWYKRAVAIRSFRNPSKTKPMLSAIRAICRTATSYKRRQDTQTALELENFEVAKSNQKASVTDKIYPFLRSMIDLYLEASQICESTTVFLGLCQDEHIKQIRNRLQQLTTEIHKVFKDLNNADLKSSMSRLFHLRLECENLVNRLVEILQ